MTYWQVAAGEGAREYSDVFLKYGIMFMGSGNPGPYPERREWYRAQKWGGKIVALADQVQGGDIVVLKRPHRRQWRIVAVGRVTGEYEWLEQFGDVEGWDLQHSRRVEWVSPRSQTLVEGLSMGTFRRFHMKELQRLALQINEEGEKRQSEEIPPPTNNISEEDLVESLISEGLRPADAESVIRAIWHVRRLATWYARDGWQLSEHEVRTFLIVPILLALGWSEQRIKIEWNHTDVSLFRDAFRRGMKDKKQEPHLILESKRMGTGLEHAERQVRKYAKDFPCCNALVTTTGVRYHLYTKKPGLEWDASRMKEGHLSAVLNLFRLKDRHPYLPGVGGAPELLKSLMPG